MKSGVHANQMREHLLLTVLGTNPRPARYTLGGREAEAPLAAVALFSLLPKEDRPDRVLALCTAEAEQDSFPLLAGALGVQLPVEALQIPAGDSQEHVDVFLEKVVGAIDQGAELTVDVTHGYRHFSFLTYVAVLYLAALRGVTIRGAYYGLLNPDDPSPFLDLRPLLDLPRWVYALEVLRDTGSALPIARNLLERSDRQTARDNARDLEHLSEAFLSGLPLELGWQSRNVLAYRRKPLQKLLGERGHRLPLADKLVGRLSDLLEPFALDESVSGEGWKRHLRLSERELGRQAKFIDDLLARESHATALGLMREWLVSWVVYQQAPDDDWLSRQVRQRAEGLLHAIKALSGDPGLRGILGEEQRKLGAFWNDLAEVRNAYAHHGMRGDDLVRDRTVAAARDRVLGYWQRTLRSCPAVSLSIGPSPGGRVLVSPIGFSPRGSVQRGAGGSGDRRGRRSDVVSRHLLARNRRDD